jgi:hypothetical protein
MVVFSPRTFLNQYYAFNYQRALERNYPYRKNIYTPEIFTLHILIPPYLGTVHNH